MMEVERGAWKTSLIASTGADGGSFGVRSRADEKFSSGGEVKGRASFLKNPAGAASGSETKTPWLPEWLASLMLQQARPHAKWRISRRDSSANFNGKNFITHVAPAVNGAITDFARTGGGGLTYTERVVGRPL